MLSRMNRRLPIRRDGVAHGHAASRARAAMLPRRQTAPLALALVCAWLLLPSSSTSGEQEHGAPLEVIGFDGLLGALAHGHAAHGHGPAGRADRQEGGVLAAALRRGLANALRDAPRLRVMPHRRSLHPGQEMRLEVEETGHAVTVSRASLLLHRWRRPGGLPTGARDEAALRSAATYHRYDTATPQGLLDLNCTVRALLKTDTKWKPDGSTGNGDQAIKGEYNVISHSVAGSEADQQWVLAVVVRDMRNYKLAQWANSGSDQNFDGLEYDPERLGFSIVKYNHRTGNVPWESGTGGTGYADGKATEAVFSDRITSLAWYPSCSATDWRNKMCPPVRPGPARPSFYQPQGGEQWIFVVGLRARLCACVRASVHMRTRACHADTYTRRRQGGADSMATLAADVEAWAEACAHHKHALP